MITSMRTTFAPELLTVCMQYVVSTSDCSNILTLYKIDKSLFRCCFAIAFGGVLCQTGKPEQTQN